MEGGGLLYLDLGFEQPILHDFDHHFYRESGKDNYINCERNINQLKLFPILKQ